MVNLSKRLKALVSLAEPGQVAADIGCDHGYVGIWLVTQNIFSKVIAMDVRSGPLEIAGKNMERYDVASRMEIRLSDGLDKLKPGEADTMFCAGMGGALTCGILSRNLDKAKLMKQVVLQPQSEIRMVRHFLRENGFVILKEDIVKEDGKYYPMFLTAYSPKEGNKKEPCDIFEYYGELLLKQKHPVLEEWLRKELSLTEQIIADLAQNIIGKANEKTDNERKVKRLHELQEDKNRLEKALAYFA